MLEQSVRVEFQFITNRQQLKLINVSFVAHKKRTRTAFFYKCIKYLRKPQPTLIMRKYFV